MSSSSRSSETVWSTSSLSTSSVSEVSSSLSSSSHDSALTTSSSSSHDSWMTTSSSSSSSGDIIHTGKSTLVVQLPVQTPVFSARVVTLDLDAIDTCKVQKTAWRYIDMAGTYAGFVIAASRVKVEDGAAFVLRITPRLSATQENAVYAAWWNALVGRVRAAMTEIRDEYDVAQCPQCDLRGDKV